MPTAQHGAKRHPAIIAGRHPLPHARHIEFPTWCADKLREAMALGPNYQPEADPICNLLLKAMAR